MHNKYHYEGPLPLGSVVAHNCAGAGLFVATHGEEVAWRLTGSEENGFYTLCIVGPNQQTKRFSSEITAEGRRIIGRDVLYYLREAQGFIRVGKWGSLVGVRPTKLFHKLWDETGKAGVAAQILRDRYDISLEKLSILQSITELQRPWVAVDEESDRRISVYGGIPFCESHCTYCSFPFGLVQQYNRLDEFVQAFVQDASQLAALQREFNLSVDSLYMGGGTPTSLNHEAFEKVVEALAMLRMEGKEFTVEAGRPDSVTPEKIDTMLRHGVNRMSINPQSMQDHILKAVGRAHTAGAVVDLYDYVREHTSLAINMDFIAGLPQQTMSDMQENMKFICRTMPENVTIHTLALKKGSPLYDMRETALLPEEGQVEEMVSYAGEYLRKIGYVPYYLYRQKYMTGQMENIGYTLPGYACEYNIRIMEERQTIVAVGPGSSSKWMRAPEFRQLQLHTPKDVSVYIDTLDTLLAKRRERCEQFWEA